MNTRELIENYTAYTDALEISHSAAADSTARSAFPATSPFSLVPGTFPDATWTGPEVLATFAQGC